MWFRPLLGALLLARLTAAQVPGATVSGVVRDSIAHAPLAGATVQLVAADSFARFGRTTVSDSLGRFTIGDVPDGRYMIGFFHPMLDSLGIAAPLREVYVDSHRSVRTDLAIPSAARLREAICGAPSVRDASATDGGGVVVGVVRDAQTRSAAAGVTVIGEWLELSFRPTGGVDRRIPRLTMKTNESGWFALCNVPSPGIMALSASHGADSTDQLEIQVPAEGFLRRDLYLGPARVVVTGDTTKRADTLAPPPTRRRAGDGRLSGTVVAAVGAKPLTGAQVTIPGGPQAIANERGEWTLVGAPSGTRMLEVRAVGYYPARRAVDVVADATSIRIALPTMKAVLDTVRVTASLNKRNLSGFEDRRRSSVGKYFTQEDVARYQPLVTSDLFRRVPGLRLERDTLGETQVSMRGATEDRCTPAVYVDGHYMSQLSTGEIDNWVSPDEVAGIEIYDVFNVPAQFSMGMSGVAKPGSPVEVCGSIVIWTRLRPRSAHPPS